MLLKLQKKKKEYRTENAVKISEHRKEYRTENAVKIAEQKHNFYENNKEKIAEQHHNNYENNKEKIAEKGKIKFTCECGSTLRISDKSAHFRTLKHINYCQSLESCAFDVVKLIS